MKSIFVPVWAALLLGGCAPTQPDLTPIGEGLKAIGIALVVFGVVGALANLIRSGERPRNQSTRSKPSRPRRPDRPGGGSA